MTRWYKTKVERFWDEAFKGLHYTQHPFNDSESVAKWNSMGFHSQITGDQCDARDVQPEWNQKFIELFPDWDHVGCSYYRMKPGTVMPNHSDKFKRFKQVFNITDDSRLWRALVMMEDWKSGHYLEVDGNAMVHWKAGDMFVWNNDVPHIAANIGEENRYTLQITGYAKENFKPE